METKTVRNPESLKLVLYVDMASQPARAVMAFCISNKLKHEIKYVAVRKGEHRQEPFASINPAQ